MSNFDLAHWEWVPIFPSTARPENGLQWFVVNHLHLPSSFCIHITRIFFGFSIFASPTSFGLHSASLNSFPPWYEWLQRRDANQNKSRKNFSITWSSQPVHPSSCGFRTLLEKKSSLKYKSWILSHLLCLNRSNEFLIDEMIFAAGTSEFEIQSPFMNFFRTLSLTICFYYRL